MKLLDRVQQAEVLLAAFDWDVEHCRQVRDLAVMLFDQLQSLHRLTPAHRDLLEAAALLHDIGWTIGHAKHHKHSYQLIHESQRSLSAFTAHEVELIANVARYHRKALPALKHEPFAALTEADRQLVRQLAGILRIADGLDRPHRQAVQALQCEITPRQVSVGIYASAEAGDYIAGAQRKSALFGAAFNCRIDFFNLS